MVNQSFEHGDLVVDLAAIKRNSEIIEGVIQSVRPMKLPQKYENGTTIIEEVTLVVLLPGGVTGYCPASAFRERPLHSYTKFMSQKDSFIIKELDLENNVALLSANEAAQLRRKLANPWFNLADKVGELVEGKVVQADSKGVYVQIEPSVKIIASKVRALEAPAVGDFVSCRLRRLEPELQRGRVIIVAYL
ncbi:MULTISPECIES: hypothetical protein [unclassified Sporosarcina]|uniref:hypothetical protein n=1 Tax=unclassified Sporosarcina TaxID=2647733 RepID=UPI001A918F27|nr:MULTISPECIES: hypothetical protein [unclassified Sporosarcina]MBO0588204.1 hypothetical protein [Sporosarcina sp. E16_8]MBO0601958.1 hypothetical protein [Sporosarcina sp. E16_3]